MPIIDETIKGQAREFLSINNMPECIINQTIKRSILDCLSFPHTRTNDDMNHIFMTLIQSHLRMFRDNQQTINNNFKRKQLAKIVTCTIVNGNDVYQYEYKRP